MSRLKWQEIAEEKLHAADALLAAGEWASAYYLAGYAVECGLKSCIIARLAKEPHLIFEDEGKKYSERCWTHKVGELLKLAGLEADHTADLNSKPIFKRHWMWVEAWSERSRYERKDEAAARNLYNAITDTQHGVMTWIRTYW